MFDRDLLARALDDDVPCEMPMGGGRRCGQPASWSVPVGEASLSCCPIHMEQSLQMYRASKQQNKIFEHQIQILQESEQDRLQQKEPETEGFRNYRFPKPPRNRPKPRS
ncbi:MAG: hypothetical protein NVS2B12_40070 [Ktedonobacteraceae bacterium]